MITKKWIKMGMLSLSATVLLAACDNDDTLETTPVEDETMTDEQTDDEVEETAEEEASTEDDTVEEDTTEDESQETSTTGLESMIFEFNLDDAIDLFYETFESEDINIEEIQFEHDDNRFVYEFEGWDGEYEYELDIDAETGDIIKQEKDDNDDTEDSLDLDGIISPQEAMETALEASGSGYVEEWKLEVEDGRTIYKIDIEEGDDQEIDAHTGDVL
ncbi:PepSY domain-containing protein [Alkalibacterium sp.]|nr:MAG: hypothetical protein EA249_08045 [Alkalibacterium sp.]